MKTVFKCILYFLLFIIFINIITILPLYLSAKKEKKREQQDKIRSVEYIIKQEDERLQLEEQKKQKEIERIQNKPPIKKQKSHSLAVAFTYEDEKLLPSEIDALCNPEPKDKKSLYNIIPWYQDKASDNGVSFNLKMDCFKSPVKLPTKFISKTGDPQYQACAFSPTGKTRQPIKNTDEIDNYLIGENPTLSNYQYLSVVHFNNQQIPQCSVAQQNGSTFFLMVRKGEPAKNTPFTSFHYYNNTVNITFAHELAHLLGATDKYLFESSGCKTDLNGKEYPKEEIMCRGYSLDLATVSDTTVKELDWK